MYPTCTHLKESMADLAMPPVAEFLQQFKPVSLLTAVGLATLLFEWLQHSSSPSEGSFRE